jgi:uncharacterized protein with FMN-binding domain
MRRAVTAILVTIAVVVLLVNFKAQAPALRTATSVGAKTTSTAAPARTTGSGGTTSATGSAVSSQYGTVQVKVTKSGGRITAVKAVTMTADSPRSQEIDAQAEPLLRQEALQAQSASIDVVSGATYTSEAYIQSLQGALDGASQQS